MSKRHGNVVSFSSIVGSLKAGSTYSVLLMSLHTARRLLIVQIENANLEGAPTGALERDLSDNRRKTREFLAYLQAHPSAA